MTDRITMEIAHGVADVRLTHANKMNALDPAMFEALRTACGRLSEERGLRAIVLSGEGRAFCAGLDVGTFHAIKDGAFLDLETRTHGISNALQYAVLGWRELPVLVIAAVHDIAFGGGFQLALGADVRYVAPDTRISIMEIKGASFPTWAVRSSCVTLRARTWCGN